jgi:tetratricopeptide (TPR) repeat protein
MKKFYALLVISMLISGCSSDSTDNQATTEEPEARKTVDLPRFPSPAANVQQAVGRSTVTLNYSRPTVISPDGVNRTNKIWGKQVPYEMNFRPAMGGGEPRPWRAGANENTTIEFSHDATIEGQSIQAGKYGIHMLIQENGKVTIIFSNVSDAWGSFSYEESNDALRVEVQSEAISNTERLIYSFQEVSETSTKITLDWEKKRIPFTVGFDTHGMVMRDLKAYLSDTTGLTWRDYNRAAIYAAANRVNLSDGMNWIEKSLAMETNYTNMSTKADLFSAQGKTVDATEFKNQALELPKTTANNYYSYGTQLIRIGQLKAAMAIFNRQNERFPDHWLTAHGYGRIYSALGDYKKALTYEEAALSDAPQANKGFIIGAIEQLKTGRDFN